jgi:chromate reductase
MKLLAFAASNSKKSINKQLVNYAITLMDDVNAEVIDLNDFETPLFSVDLERASGIPEPAFRFYRKIGEADALLISYAEHNGSYTAAFKNLFDWTSRINGKVYQGKPVVMLATSPGARGALSVLTTAVASAARFGADLKGSLSVASFNDNFDTQAGNISNPEIRAALEVTLASLFKL